MFIKTKSGSYYHLFTKDGELYLMQGTREYLVKEISKMGIGLPLEVVCYELNIITYTPHESETIIQTSPIVEIS